MQEYPLPIPWQDDLSRLQLGVETEHLLFREEQPASRSDVDELFSRMRLAGFQPGPRDGEERLLYVWRKTKQGPIALKIDYCPHIVEWAYPPLTEIDCFCSLYGENRSILEECADHVGLKILPDAVLPDVPNKCTFVCSPHDSERLRRLNERPDTFGPFGHRYCLAVMAAAQVHLNILDSQFFTRLPLLYQMEYLVPLLFSNGRCFREQRAYCVRPLIYRDSFDSSYLACGVPACVPSSPVAYQTMVDSGHNVFRDYSFISPSRHGTVEFRSACSQNTVAKIVQLIALRVGVVWAARQGRVQLCGDPRSLFYKTCETGDPPQDVVRRDLAILGSVAGELPDAMCTSLRSLIRGAESLSPARFRSGEQEATP